MPAAKPAPGFPATLPHDGRVRAVIEGVHPEVDDGRFPIKRTVGESVTVEADAFTDGHDELVCVLRYRHQDEADWRETAMKPVGNDRWRGRFRVDRVGRYCYTVAAWVDPFLSWRHDFARRVDAEDIAVAVLVGSEIILAASGRAEGSDADHLLHWGERLAGMADPGEARRLGLDADLATLAARYPDRRLEACYERELDVVVDPERARFSAWYELFPRSCAREPGRHGTFKDVEARLPHVAAMGFDVLYLPPIHPIGRIRRKGSNNVVEARPEDVGSPWAIGSDEGGHKAIHPQLGSLEDFRRLAARARALGIEIALDIAFQCAPDHPYVKQHPEWFRWRPDGTVQYAENPPKKYQDIYPFNFECDAWPTLWQELKSIFRFWIDQGVTIFRVDNPHTKPFPFWEWVIGELKREHPQLIFLAEAFTRPKVMHRLAKLGYSQSYTYFAWRNTKHELTDYFTELAAGPGREYFRPNVWPNTPDILTEQLQFGGRAAFCSRLLLAATLAASYGIYGPAFELLDHEAREPGSEEYKDSEKYQLRHWDLEREDSLRDMIARVNRIRRDNPALQADRSLAFLSIENEQLIAYSKTTEDAANTVIAVVNLDPYNAHAGWLELDLEALGLDTATPYQMQELLSGAHYLWSGPRNFVQLSPGMGQVFRLRRRVRSERDFDYFM